MFWLGLALVTLGAAAKVTGKIIENKKAQEEKREQAQHAIDQTNYQRDTNLGIMEKQLIASMESDYQQAQDLEVQRTTQSVASSQSTFMSQLAAEEDYAQGLVQNERASAELTSAMGSSGAQQDVALAAIVNEEMNQAAAVKRSSIDKGRGLSTYQLNAANQASKTAQGRIESRYEPGSATRNLYNYQRQRIIGGAELETNYLDDVVTDNSDYLSWDNWWGSDAMWGDMLNIGSGILDIASFAVGNYAAPLPDLSGGTKASGRGSSLYTTTPMTVR